MWVIAVVILGLVGAWIIQGNSSSNLSIAKKPREYEVDELTGWKVEVNRGEEEGRRRDVKEAWEIEEEESLCWEMDMWEEEDQLEEERARWERKWALEEMRAKEGSIQKVGGRLSIYFL